MGRNPIHSNLLQCATCGDIFEAPSEFFRRGESFLRSRDGLECPKCSLHSHVKRIGTTIRSIPTPCRNRSNGCPEELPPCEMAVHQANCEHRPVRCIWYLQCEEKEIRFRDYRKHLEMMHQPYVKKVHLNEPYDVTIKHLKDHVVKVSAVVCDERKQLYFTRRCSIDLQQNLFMVCVHYIGEREDARKFVYKVKIQQGLDSLHTFYEYSNYCAPCVETPNSPDAHAQCVVLQPKRLFLTDQYLYELKYSVTIKRVKSAAAVADSS